MLDEHFPHAMQYKVDKLFDCPTESPAELELPWFESRFNHYVFHLGQKEVVRSGGRDGLHQVTCGFFIFLSVGK